MSEENTHQQFDIVIVGGGLVGGTLALLLAEADNTRPLRIALIEAGKEPQAASLASFDPRVVALTRQSQNLLDSLGVWQSVIEQRACAYSDMHVWDGDGTASIHFDSLDVGEANLGHIVENRIIIANLHEKIRGLKNIHCFFSAPVEQLGGTQQERELILSDGQVVVAPLIVAADGARSKLRELAAFSMRQWSYGHKAIVTTAVTELPHQFTAWQRFLTSGPLAFLPLQRNSQAATEEYHSSIVWSLADDEADRMMALSDEDFNLALGRGIEHRLGKIKSSDQRFCFPLTARHTDQYFQPGLVLVGDAAHSIHPLAGQGVNLGLADAQVLAAEIKRACSRSIELGDESILRRYQRQRKSHNLLTLSLMEAFKRLFGAEQLPIRWLRSFGLRKVDQLQWLKLKIVRMMLAN